MFGFIKQIKEHKEMMKQLKETLNENIQKQSAYIAMAPDERFSELLPLEKTLRVTGIIRTVVLTGIFPPVLC